MPAIPPTPNLSWIHGPDETGNFATGYQLAQAAAGQRQRLQLAMQQMQQEADMKRAALQVNSENAQRKAAVDLQKAEIAKSYHEQATAVNMQRMQMAKQQADMKMQEFANQAAAQQSLQEAVAAAQGDREKISQAYMMYGPAAFGGSGAGLGPIIKDLAPQPSGPIQTQPVLDPSGAVMPDMYGVGGKAYQRKNEPTTQDQKDKSMMIKNRLDMLNGIIQELVKTRASTTDKKLAQQQDDQIKAYMDQYDKVQQSLTSDKGGGGKKRYVWDEGSGQYVLEQGDITNIPDFMQSLEPPVPEGYSPDIPGIRSIQDEMNPPKPLDMPIPRAGLPFGM